MARKITTLLQDDMDGSEADETITFGLDGVSYEIDLNTKHAENLRTDSLQPYVSAGRRVGARLTRRTPATVTPVAATGPTSRPKPAAGKAAEQPADTPVDAAAVRAWAAAHKIPVSPKGRIPGALILPFRAPGN